MQKKTGQPEPTGIIISESTDFGNKLRINETRRQQKEILMPYNFYLGQQQDLTEGWIDDPSLGALKIRIKDKIASLENLIQYFQKKRIT